MTADDPRLDPPRVDLDGAGEWTVTVIRGANGRPVWRVQRDCSSDIEAARLLVQVRDVA